MSITEGRWEGNTSFPDGQIFIGPDELHNTGGTMTLTLNASGDLSLNAGATQTCVIVATLDSLFRTGVLASSYDQQQFGTAASVAGPSSVAGTSGPLALKPGFPPIASSQMATLGAIQTGPVPKGFQIDSLDLIYLISGAALTLHQIGVTQTKFVNNVAAAVTNYLAKAANGLATATQANPYVTRVNMTTPAMITATDNVVIIEVDATTQGGGAYRLYGACLQGHFNFN